MDEEGLLSGDTSGTGAGVLSAGFTSFFYMLSSEDEAVSFIQETTSCNVKYLVT